MKNIFTKKRIFIVVILAIIIFVFIQKSKSTPQLGVSVNVAKVEIKTIEEIISVKSPLDGIEKADVVSPLNYEIIDIKVKEGDIVTKDQILAVLDSEDLQKEINSAQRQIELSQLEQNDRIKSLQTDYDKILFQISEIENTYNQNKVLYENGIITEEALNKIESSLKEVKKGLESFNVVDGKIVPTSSEVKKIEIQKEELQRKREDLDKIYIKSPIAGTVTRVNVNLGRYAKDTEGEKAMFVVENLEKLQMKVKVSEFDITKIQIGQEVDIYSDVLGSESVKGIVSRISPTAEQKDNNDMERVIPVQIDVTEKPENLIAGVVATAKIKVAKSENVLVVPSGAVIQSDSETFKIFTIKDDNTLQSIPVEIGLETDLETEIKGGNLSENLQIVANPNYSLTDGMLVTPIELEGSDDIGNITDDINENSQNEEQ